MLHGNSSLPATLARPCALLGPSPNYPPTPDLHRQLENRVVEDLVRVHVAPAKRRGERHGPTRYTARPARACSPANAAPTGCSGLSLVHSLVDCLNPKTVLLALHSPQAPQAATWSPPAPATPLLVGASFNPLPATPCSFNPPGRRQVEQLHSAGAVARGAHLLRRLLQPLLVAAGVQRRRQARGGDWCQAPQLPCCPSRHRQCRRCTPRSTPLAHLLDRKVCR